MPLIPYLLCQTVILWLSVAPILMLLRSLRGMFAPDADPTLVDVLLAAATEPLIMPARFLMGEAAEEMPFDMPFLLTLIAIFFLRTALPAVTPA